MNVISDALAILVQRQKELETRLLRLEAAIHIEAAPPALAHAEPEPVPPPMEAPPAPPVVEPHKAGLETSIGLTLVNRVGVVTLVLGIGFLFKYAVDNNYIGPAGRVELGLLAGLLAVGGADVLWRRGQRTFAQGLTAAGVSILYLALFAAFALYHLVPQGVAFAAMAVTTLMAGAMALRYDAVAISALALTGGLLTPMLLSSGPARPWFLFGYLLLLDSAAMVLAKRKQWRVLEPLAFCGTVLLYGGWIAGARTEGAWPATIALLLLHGLFAGLTSFQPILVVSQLLAGAAATALWPMQPAAYFPVALALATIGLAAADRRGWPNAVTAALSSFWLWSWLFCLGSSNRPVLGALFSGLSIGFVLFLGWIPWWLLVRRRRARSQDLILLAVNGAAYFGVGYGLLNPRYHAWMGLFAAAVAGMHLALGYVLWNREQPDASDRRPVLLAGGAALTFLTLAAPIQLTTWRITMAWALQAAALAWLSTQLAERRVRYGSALIFALALLRLVIVDAWIYRAGAAYTLLANDRFATFAVGAACLFLAAYWLREPKWLRLALYLAGHFVLLWGLTQEVLGSAARSASRESMVSVETISVSLLFAMYAVALISFGVGTRTLVNRIAGLVLIGVVVLKLYLFDVWQLGHVYRTLAFVVLGILLLSTSFLYSHFRALIGTWWKDDEAQP